MKKKLIYSTAVAALLSASSVFAGGPEMVMVPPSPFDGFYIGGDVSFHQTGFDIDSNLVEFDVPGFSSFSTFTPLLSRSGGDSSIDAYYGVRGGWGRVFMNRWYAGIEGFADFGNSDGSINVSGEVFDEAEYAYVNSSGHIGTQYGVAGRLGILLSPTTLAYTKLGAVWANVKASQYAQFATEDEENNRTIISITPVVNSSGSSTEAAFLWGFGAEQFVYKDVVSIFAEYTHASFGTASTSDNFYFYNNPDTGQQYGIQFNNSTSVEVSSFTGGINLHFGRDWL